MTMETPSEAVLAALNSFLAKNKITDVHLAEGTTPPLPLAYNVHFPRIAVTLKGEDSMWIERGGQPTKIFLGPGQALVIPPNHWNRPEWNRSVTTVNILFGRKQLGISLVRHDGKSSVSPQALKTTLNGALSGPARDILKALLGINHRAKEVGPLLVEALLHCCRSMLSASPNTQESRAQSLYAAISLHVQENFQHPLSRDDIAKHFNISPNHVSRIFKKEGLTTFNDFVTFVRLDRAKYLLQSFNQTVDEIAIGCGFADTSYFCRVFKAKTKLTPTDYRSAYSRRAEKK